MNKLIISIVTFLGLISPGAYLNSQIDSATLKCETSQVYSILELNGIRGQNVDFSNPTGPSPLCSSGGGPHNTSWWTFYSQGGNHKFEIEFNNCTLNGTGVQFGIIKGCDPAQEVVCDPGCNGPGKKSFSADLEPFQLYSLFVDGCSGDVCDFVLTTAPPKAYINTNTFLDSNGDCIFQNTEKSVEILTIVQEYKGLKYFFPSNIGKIPLYDRDLGKHIFYIKESSGAIVTCQKTYEYDIDFISPIPDLNIGITRDQNCEELMTEITTDRLRFCNDVTYKVDYSNLSVEDISNSYLEVTIPDVFSFVSSSIPASAITHPIIRFDLGNLTAMSKGSFTIVLKTPCEQSLLGNTYCVESHIYPDNPCPKSISWDKSTLSITTTCDKSRNKVQFKVKNIGAGAMDKSSEFSIIEDEIMPLLKGNIQLGLNEEKLFEFPANGHTYRMIVEQSQNHPGNSRPTKFIEGCGVSPNGETSKGFVLGFPEDDVDRFKSFDCKELRGAFDPNDKLAEPKGFSNRNFIEKNQTIKYTVRFQNTGNDYADLVRVVDRLESKYDINSFEVVGSSHPMKYSIREGVVEFVFDSINLPYAKLDEEKSNGYVSYRIKINESTPIGAIIENIAEIYFDRNQPIYTNVTRHEVWEPVITQVFNSVSYDFAKLYPNPAQDDLFINVRTESLPVRFELINPQGSLIRKQNITTNESHLNLESLNLSNGIYLIVIQNNIGEKSIHKLIIKK
ncbi:MAG: T9SS type A sorting domain-containing protein [Saprospiraceae bacterium]|nr:T9SS type A sorting domain-containing protein [Saprospiraceae bacterium]